MIENAEYFTTIRRANLRYIREEHKSLAEAKAYACGEIAKNPSYRFIIYAVHESNDTFVDVASAETCKQST